MRVRYTFAASQEAMQLRLASSFNMAAATSQQSSRSEEIPTEVTSQIVPTLLQIERRKYKLGTDEHYRYFYLAQRLVTGTEKNNLVKKKLSQMYSIFETQHGKREALALMIFLFKACDDPLSAEKLEALTSADGHYHRASLLFLVEESVKRREESSTLEI